MVTTAYALAVIVAWIVIGLWVRPKQKGIRDAGAIERESMGLVDRRSALAVRPQDADTTALDLSAVGIGAAVHGDPITGSKKGERHLGRKHIRVVSPPKRLVRRDHSECCGTSLVRKP